MEGGAKALARKRVPLQQTGQMKILTGSMPRGQMCFQWMILRLWMRDDKTYEEGHLKDTLQVDLKDIESPDDLFIIQDGAKTVTYQQLL